MLASRRQEVVMAVAFRAERTIVGWAMVRAVSRVKTAMNRNKTELAGDFWLRAIMVELTVGEQCNQLPFLSVCVCRVSLEWYAGTRCVDEELLMLRECEDERQVGKGTATGYTSTAKIAEASRLPYGIPYGNSRCLEIWKHASRVNSRSPEHRRPESEDRTRRLTQLPPRSI